MTGTTYAIRWPGGRRHLTTSTLEAQAASIDGARVTAVTRSGP